MYYILQKLQLALLQRSLAALLGTAKACVQPHQTDNKKCKESTDTEDNAISYAFRDRGTILEEAGLVVVLMQTRSVEKTDSLHNIISVAAKAGSAVFATIDLTTDQIRISEAQI